MSSRCLPVGAQVATVTALERVTEKKTGEAGLWRPARRGDTLAINDRFRTGKRSKADIKFADGSLVRLGQLSSIEIRDARNVTLLGGQVLFSALHRGRVLAGTAVGEITGSVGIVTLNRDGSSEFSLFSGGMNVQAPRQTVPLPNGYWVSVGADGTPSPVRVAPPLEFAFSELMPELTDTPVDSPFAGSRANVRMRSAPERLALDQYNPRVDRNEAIPLHLASQPTPGSGVTPGSGGGTTGEIIVRRAQVAGVPAGAGVGQAGVLAPQAGVLAPQAASGLDTTAADRHLGDIDRGLGRSAGGDAGLLAAYTDGGNEAYGARLHGFATQGRWYAEAAALPLRSRVANGTGHVTHDISSFPLASLTHRDRWGDIQVGRQRFLEGPMQAAQFGSLIRPGEREVMDAVRVRPNLGANHRLELAYIYDAFVRNLPYQQGGAQHGWYGRLSTEQTYGNFGLNVLRYQNIAGPLTTGASVDFALPLVRHQIEGYGELGRDPFRRRLRSFGLAFPGLHARTDIDLFLEYATMRTSAPALAEPDELAIRAYRPIGRNVYVVANYSHLRKQQSVFTVGLAIGARSYRGAPR